ncbi:MAG: MFS transporter [Thermodesulfobacteriota bacterium]
MQSDTPGSAARKALTYRWTIFCIMAVAYVFVYFHRLCPAVVATDLQKSLSASAGFMGLLASAYFYPYAIMQLPAGLLSDSLGPRITVTAFLVLAGVGGLLFGLAPNVWVALLARVMVGLGVSMVFIPAMKLLSQWFRVREFAFMTAILGTMGGIGALSAAMPLAFLTGWIGWRLSFELIGAGTLVMAALVWLFVRNRPQDLGWPTILEIDYGGSGQATPPQHIPVWEGVKQVVTNKHFWPVALWFFFTCGVFFGFGGLWAGPYLMQMYGMTKAEAGGVLNMIAVGMIVGSPLMSFLSDKVLHSRKKVIMVFSTLQVLLMAFVVIYPRGLPSFALYAFMLLLSVSSSAIVIMGFTTTKELFPVEIAGTSVGTVNLFPFLGGGIFQPVLGWILDSYPRTASGAYASEAYQIMLVALLVASIIALGCVLPMKETFPSPSPERRPA